MVRRQWDFLLTRCAVVANEIPWNLRLLRGLGLEDIWHVSHTFGLHVFDATHSTGNLVTHQIEVYVLGHSGGIADTLAY